MKNIFLTGKPGTGKTTIIKKVIADLDLKIGGFYTEEIREQGERIGFKVHSTNGEEGLLARKDIKSHYRVGKYGVLVSSFEIIGVKAVENAVQNAELILIDELGRMELFSKKFQSAVYEALECPKTVLGVIQQRKNPFLNKIRKRDDVQIFTITEENRDELPGKIMEIIKNLSKTGS